MSSNESSATGRFRPPKSWKGDFLGPLTAASISIPVEANYGAIALAPLGLDYMAYGVIAALLTSMFANLGVLATGGSGSLLGGTRPALVLAVAALIAERLANSSPSS